METPDLDLSSGSSRSSSPQETEHVRRTKNPTKLGRKRRSEDCQAKSSRSKPNNAHNLIEKKYRNNLNNKIQALRDCIPSLHSTVKEEGGENDMDSDAGESRKAQKCNKVRF